MQNNIIPVSYFPTTVIFIDDNKDFLTNLALGLDSSLSVKCYQSAKEALHAIHCKQQQNFLDDTLSTEMIFSNTELTPYSVHHEVYNPLRFCEISVIVTDYDMPEMNGVEFCKLMETNEIKRILLTGQASEQLSLQAVKDKLINCYLTKQSTNLKEMLEQTIQQLQLQYFQDMSRTIARFIPQSKILLDPKVIELFNQIIKENQIVEYYKVDESSYLLLDAAANLSYFLIKSAADVTNDHELFQKNAKELNKDTLQKLKQGSMILDSAQALQLSETNWVDHLYQAQKVGSDDQYWYTYTKTPRLSHLYPQQILSYNRYLEHCSHTVMATKNNGVVA